MDNPHKVTRRRSPNHDWSLFEDGTERFVTTDDPSSVRSGAYQAARKRNMKAHCHVTNIRPRTGIWVRFSPIEEGADQ